MKQIISILIAITILSGGYTFAGENKGCTLPTQECLDRMVTQYLGAGIVGVEGDVDESSGGLRVTNFIEGSNAEAAGVQVDDILLTINGIALSDREAYKADAANRTLGEIAAITLLRGGNDHTLDVELAEIPVEMIEKEIGHHMAKYHVETDLEKVKAKRKTKTKAKRKTKTKAKAKA